VSVEAISWALNLAPVPADRGGQPSSACKFVLVGLANHAGPDGTAAFPSVATLVRYTGLSERTVRACLDRLQAEGLISPCDPDIVAARIKRADRRPQGWDLSLSLVRDDLDATAAAILEHQFPRLGVRLSAAARGTDGHTDGVQSRTPLPPAARLWITGVTRCSCYTPQAERGATSAPTGCNRCSHGVQRLHPNHPRNHPGNRPPPPRACTRARPSAGRAAGRLASSSQTSATPGCSPRDSGPGSPQLWRLRLAAGGPPAELAGIRGRQPARGAQPVRCAGRPAFACGAARPALAFITSAAVVRRVRRADPSSRARRRSRCRTMPGMPSARCESGPQPGNSACALAVLHIHDTLRRSPTARRARRGQPRRATCQATMSCSRTFVSWARSIVFSSSLAENACRYSCS
jgi:Helix-turn-helix domain